jgi:hypothetical protein
MIGHPVCVLLKNGSYYVGWITGIERGELILSGKKGRGRLRNSTVIRKNKARIAGLFPDFGLPINNFGGIGPSMLSPVGAAAPNGGGAGFLGGLGGLGGIMSFVQKAWPAFRMGMGMVKTIMPLFGGLKG